MPRFLIGVAGRMASGKGSVAKYMQQCCGAERHRSSDPLRQVVDIFALPQSRENLSRLSTFLRQTYGEHIIAHAMVRLLEQAKSEFALFDGMRRLIDLETFRPMPHFTFVFVDCDQRTRYQRYISRNENPGDAEMSWEEFIRRDTAETEEQIDLLKEHADYVIDNNDSYEELERRIEAVVNEIRKNPTDLSHIG